MPPPYSQARIASIPRRGGHARRQGEAGASRPTESSVPDCRLQNRRADLGNRDKPIVHRNRPCAFVNGGPTPGAPTGSATSWLMTASCTYSQLRGNYNGLILPGNGELLPHVNAEYDFLSVLPNRFGPLAGDVPNSFKMDAAYVYEVSPNLALNLGANFSLNQGEPIKVL